MESFIRSVFFGSAAVRFHRPDSGLGLGKQAQAVIKSMRELANRMDFFEGTPDNSLLLRREPNEAYCRAIPGKQYAVYFTNGGGVTMDLSSCEGVGRIQWLNIITTSWGKAAEIKSLRNINIDTPDKGQWVALIIFN
jgi:hypothetical protein